MRLRDDGLGVSLLPVWPGFHQGSGSGMQLAKPDRRIVGINWYGSMIAQIKRKTYRGEVRSKTILPAATVGKFERLIGQGRSWAVFRRVHNPLGAVSSPGAFDFEFVGGPQHAITYCVF